MKTLTIQGVIIITVTLFAQACGSGRDKVHDASAPLLVNLELAIGNEREFLLSELATDIKLVPLETREDALIGSGGAYPGVPVILTPDGFMLIPQNRSPLCIFDSEGRYVRTIGSIGRGPGEYSANYYAVYCSEQRHIYIKNNFARDILEFDWEGNFIKKFQAETDLLNFEVMEKGRFLGALSLFPPNDTLGYNYVIFNDKGETLTTISIQGNAIVNIAPPGSDQLAAYVIRPLLLKGEKGININTTRNDTIFTIDRNGNLTYSLTWEKGRFTSDFPAYLYMIYRDRADKYLFVQTVAETSKYWYLTCQMEKKIVRFLIDKEDGTAYSIRRIRNDIDGTVTVMPGLNTIGNKVITLWDPLSLKKLISTPASDKVISTPASDDETLKYPERQKAFREMVEALKEDDNPVVTIITFR